jgi:hypothetical protein
MHTGRNRSKLKHTIKPPPVAYSLVLSMLISNHSCLGSALVVHPILVFKPHLRLLTVLEQPLEHTPRPLARRPFVRPHIVRNRDGCVKLALFVSVEINALGRVELGKFDLGIGRGAVNRIRIKPGWLRKLLLGDDGVALRTGSPSLRHWKLPGYGLVFPRCVCRWILSPWFSPQLGGGFGRSSKCS